MQRRFIDTSRTVPGALPPEVTFNQTTSVEHQNNINRTKGFTHMDLEELVTKKRSLGALRKAPKTKPRSPDMTGTLRLQRHTAEAIIKRFADSDCEEVICNIAGWRNNDASGPILTVDISPRYGSRESQLPKTNNLD